MRLEYLIRAGRIEEVKVNGKEVDSYILIMSIYAKEKGYSLFFEDGEVKISPLSKRCAKIFLKKASRLYENYSRNRVCGECKDEFEETFNSLLREVNEAIEKLKKEERIILEVL